MALMRAMEYANLIKSALPVFEMATAMGGARDIE
jgi:hypothetical protein